MFLIIQTKSMLMIMGIFVVWYYQNHIRVILNGHTIMMYIFRELNWKETVLHLLAVYTSIRKKICGRVCCTLTISSGYFSNSHNRMVWPIRRSSPGRWNYKQLRIRLFWKLIESYYKDDHVLERHFYN